MTFNTTTHQLLLAKIANTLTRSRWISESSQTKAKKNVWYQDMLNIRQSAST